MRNLAGRRALGIVVCVFSISAVMARGQPGSSNRGVICGTVTTPEGTPAKGLILDAEPLGVALVMALPWTRTNDAGEFRFEHLPLGRYRVFAEDRQQGYSRLSTGPAGPANPDEVDLTAEKPEAEFHLALPPKGGFLVLHLTNQTTGAVVSGVEVKVMSTDTPPRLIFSGSFSSAEAILVPSDKNLLVHVTSPGFHEWEQSIGAGKGIRIEPGNRLTLDVQLEPANPLRARIPDSDPQKYRGIREAKDWKNPYLIVERDGIVVRGWNGGSPIEVESIAAVLEGLPDSAWPYGLVVVVQENGVRSSGADDR